MLGLIRHRGPDDEGRYIDGPCAMGMRRLSIIDLEGGKQPIANEDESIWVVFNGEIYNYVELCKDLEGRGHQFRTASDTEVLVHLYEEYGAEFPQHLNGMFGIALWDKPRQRMLLSRDPMGIKPLFWTYQERRLVFASELKCFLKAGLPSWNVDSAAMAAYLHLGYIPRERTAFQEVERLLPGHTMLLQEGGDVVVDPYWKLSDVYSGQTRRSPEDMVEEASTLLDDAVRIQLRSDVPVGVFLSGGVDSSALTAISARHLPRIDAFSVMFKDHHCEEIEYAREVAAHTDVHHHEIMVDPSMLRDELPTLTWFLDEPNWDPAMLPSYMISKYARETVKVALSGTGGDEIFGGYLRHFEPPPQDSAACWIRGHVPYGLRRLMTQLLGLYSRDKAANVAVRLLPGNNAIGMTYCVEQDKLGLLEHLSPWAADEFVTSRWVQDVFSEVHGRDAVSERMYYDSTTYLPDQILAMTDRSSMAVSLEVRVPLLDIRLVELMAGVQGCDQVTQNEGKVLFKRMLRDKLPASVLNRGKLGFGAPVTRWMSSPQLQELLHELPSGHLADSGMIDGAALRSCLAKEGALEQHAALLWSLIMLEIWYSQYVKGEMRPSGIG